MYFWNNSGPALQMGGGVKAEWADIMGCDYCEVVEAFTAAPPRACSAWL